MQNNCMNHPDIKCVTGIVFLYLLFFFNDTFKVIY